MPLTSNLVGYTIDILVIVCMIMFMILSLVIVIIEFTKYRDD